MEYGTSSPGRGVSALPEHTELHFQPSHASFLAIIGTDCTENSSRGGEADICRRYRKVRLRHLPNPVHIVMNFFLGVPGLPFVSS